MEGRRQVVSGGKRTFSKYLVSLNVALCWVLAFWAMYRSESDVAIASLAIIATVVGAYMGVGHMDFRRILDAMKGTSGYYGSDDTEPPAEGSP